MEIDLADFQAEDFQSLITDYLVFANQDTCTHALGIASLQTPEVKVFTARDETGALMGCAALKQIGDNRGEIKSVSTHKDHLRKGVSRNLMIHLEGIARKQGLTELLLETHNTPPYVPACKLYKKLGYETCGPFGEYSQTERNVFMSKSI